ncbi:MAG: hypothetical protein WBV22_00435 [Anaerolineaceae bacterium]
MKKLIRVFSYILMILGAVILLGGLGTGIAMLFARGAREMGRGLPMMRMLGSGSAIMTTLRVMLQGLLVSGFGMVIYLIGDLANPKNAPAPEFPAKTARTK